MINWGELKDFCNSLPESELGNNVIMWRESEAIVDIDVSKLEEDHYVKNGYEEDGCFVKSEAEYQIKMDSEEFPEGLNHFTKVYDKGHPILSENFMESE